MANGGNYPFISVTHQMPWSTTGGAAASTVGWYTNASTATPVSSASLTPGTTTTGWTAPATAPTTYTAGAGTPVLTSMLGNSTASKWYFSQGSNESWAGYRYIQIDIARRAGGASPATWRTFDDKYYFFASSASDGSVRHTEIEIPVFRDSAFHTLSFRLTNSSEVYTWGIISAGTATAGSSGTVFAVQNAFKRAMNEVEVALEQSTNGVVLVPNGFVQTGEQHRVDLTSNQYLLDLRSSVSQVRVEGTDRKPQSAYIDFTGTSNALEDIAQFFHTIPNDSDVYFPANGRIKSTSLDTLYLPGMKRVRLFGNRTGIFYHSGAAYTTYRNIALLQLGGQWRKEVSHQDILIKDFIFGGRPVTQTYTGGDSNATALTTLSGSKTTSAGLHTIGPTSGNEIRTDYNVNVRYLKGADTGFTTDWQYRFDFVLSADNAVANDCEIAIKDDLGTVYSTMTLTLTGVASTYTLLADAATVDPGFRVAGTVKKLTNGASTINIHSIVRWGSVNANVASAEAQHGLFIYSNFETTAESSRVQSNIVVDTCHAEGLYGDGFIIGQLNTGPLHTKIINSTSRANFRQQIAVVGGEYVEIIGNVMREYGQTGLDIEPLAADHVTTIRVEQNRFLDGLTAGYNAISAANPRVINASIQHNTMLSRTGAFLNFGGLKSVITNNHQGDYSTHSTAYSYSNGGGSVFDLIAGANDNLVIGNQMIGAYTVAGSRNVFAANRVMTSGGLVTFKDEGTDNAWYFNTQIGSSAYVSGTYYGQINITSATRPIIFGMNVKGQSDAPDTFKGQAFLTSPWFVSGLAMKTEPVKEIRGISGSTVKMNQFLITATPAANSTSATVTFTSRPVAAPTTFSGQSTTAATAYGNSSSSGGSTAGRLAATWTNTSTYYRIAGHNYYGAGSANTTLNVTLASTTSVVKITLKGLVNSSKYANGFRIYRGELTATATAYYDILPTGDAKEFARLRQDTHSIYDYGTNMHMGLVSGEEYGYTSSYAIVTDAAATTKITTDYSGAMQSTTYSVIPGTPDWNAGTIYVTAKTSIDVSIAWTGTTANGTNTIPLMFASS